MSAFLDKKIRKESKYNYFMNVYFMNVWWWGDNFLGVLLVTICSIFKWISIIVHLSDALKNFSK